MWLVVHRADITQRHKKMVDESPDAASSAEATQKQGK
jgi:hypothetical protein